MKIFGCRNGEIMGGYGVECGVVVADSEEEAKEILKTSSDWTWWKDWDNDKDVIFEIPFEKGFTLIGDYAE